MYYICAPIGSFGNHLRWLLLLSNKFTINIPHQQSITIHQKMSWLFKYVYPDDRTWHNWLNYEWRFRKVIDTSDTIEFTHDNNILDTNENSSARFICTTISPDLAYRSYMKFNNNLNNSLIERFKVDTAKANHKIMHGIDDSRVLKIDSDMLWKPQLDRTLYMRVADWFDCDKQWLPAVQLHERWFSLQQKAEREFVRDVVNLYGDNG